MKKAIIATLFAVLANTNAIAGLEINKDYSKAEIKSSVQECEAEENILQDPVKQDWVTYVSEHTGHLTAATVAALVAAGAFFNLPGYKDGKSPGSKVAKIYHQLFKMLKITSNSPFERAKDNQFLTPEQCINVARTANHNLKIKDWSRTGVRKLTAYVGALSKFGSSSTNTDVSTPASFDGDGYPIDQLDWTESESFHAGAY